MTSHKESLAGGTPENVVAKKEALNKKIVEIQEEIERIATLKKESVQLLAEGEIEHGKVKEEEKYIKELEQEILRKQKEILSIEEEIGDLDKQEENNPEAILDTHTQIENLLAQASAVLEADNTDGSKTSIIQSLADELLRFYQNNISKQTIKPVLDRLRKALKTAPTKTPPQDKIGDLKKGEEGKEKNEKKDWKTKLGELTETLQKNKGKQTSFDPAIGGEGKIEKALTLIKPSNTDTVEKAKEKADELDLYIEFATALKDTIDTAKANEKTRRIIKEIEATIIRMEKRKEDILRTAENSQFIASIDKFVKNILVTERMLGAVGTPLKGAEEDLLKLELEKYKTYIENNPVGPKEKERFGEIKTILSRTFLIEERKDRSSNPFKATVREFIEAYDKTEKKEPAPEKKGAEKKDPTPETFTDSIRKGGSLYLSIEKAPHLETLLTLIAYGNIPTEDMGTEIDAAKQQVDDILRKISLESVDTSTFAELKKEILEPIQPILDYISTLNKGDLSAKIKSLRTSLLRFATKIGLKIEKKEPTKTPPNKDKPLTVEQFEEEMRDIDKSPIARNIETALKRIIKRIDIKAPFKDTDTATISEQTKRIPDDATKESLDKLAATIDMDLKSCASKITPKEKNLHEALLDLALALDIHIEFKGGEPSKRDIVPATAEQFEDDVKNPKSKFILKIRNQLNILKAGLLADTTPDSTVKELKADIDAIPVDATEDSLEALKDILGETIRTCTSLVKETTPKSASVKELLLLLGARLGLDVVFTKKESPTTTPLTPEYVPIPSKKEDFIIDTVGELEFNRTAGFQSWIKSSIAMAMKKYSQLEIPENMKKGLAEWHEIYKTFGDKFEKLKGIISELDPSILISDLELPETATNKELVQRKALEAVGYSFFEQRGDASALDTLLKAQEKTKQAEEDIKKLEEELVRVRRDHLELNDASKTSFEAESTKILKIEMFVDRVSKDYYKLMGKMTSNTPGNAKVFYKKWIAKQNEEKEEKSTEGRGPWAKLGNKVIKIFANNSPAKVFSQLLRLGGYDSSDTTTEEHTELNRLDSKIRVLRNNRMIYEKGSGGATKEEADRKLSRFKDYLSARSKRETELEKIPKAEREEMEKIYTDLEKAFSSEDFTYTEEELVGGKVREDLIKKEGQRKRFFGDKKDTAELEHHRSKNDLDRNSPFKVFSQEIGEELLDIDIDKTLTLLRSTGPIDNATKLNAIGEGYRQIVRRAEKLSLPDALEQKIDTLSWETLNRIKRYLDKGPLVKSASDTIRDLAESMSITIEKITDMKKPDKAERAKALTELKNILINYKNMFDSGRDSYRSGQVEIIISGIDHATESILK